MSTKLLWLQSALPMPLFADTEIYTTILIVIAGIILVGGVVALYFISKKTPKGTVLAISVVLWILSCYGSGVEIREVQVITGLVRLLGTIGIILGLIELGSKRKLRKPIVFSGQIVNRNQTPDTPKKREK